LESNDFIPIEMKDALRERRLFAKKRKQNSTIERARFKYLGDFGQETIECRVKGVNFSCRATDEPIDTKNDIRRMFRICIINARRT